jgi:hypothetical protein
MTAHDLSQPPSDAIADHRAAQRLFDAEAEAAVRQLVRAKENSEVGTRAAFPGAIHGIELAFAHQPRRARKIQAPVTTRA